MTGMIAIAALGLFYALVRPAIDRRRWRLAIDLSVEGMVWGAIGVALLFFFFPIVMVVPIVIAIMVHEYGHVLAYRLIGHSAPTFRLAPFGGVALSGEPIRSEAAGAFVALMGPGFSLVLVAAGALTLSLWENLAPEAAQIAAIMLSVTGLLNAFNMAPVMPLDGGRALRAMASIAGPKVQSVLMFVLSIGAAGALAAAGMLFLAGFLAIGALLSLSGRKDPQPPRPMRPSEAILTLVTYGVIAAGHGMAALPLLQAYGVI